MISSTISPTQPAQQTHSIGKADELATRRRTTEQTEKNAQEARETRPQHHANAAQAQSPLEPLKPSVNTSGQTVGRVINTTA